MQATTQHWPDIDRAYRLVSQAAQVLENTEDGTHEDVQRHFERVLTRMRREVEHGGPLAGALQHFLKVTHSYGPQLFHTYRVAGLPRTNNDLEQFFGSARHHERRISGRKVAAPGTVIRGQVRLVAAFGTRLAPPTADQLRPSCVVAWRTLRDTLDLRHEARRAQLRFRRDPEAYLTRLEQQLLRSPLPT